ALADLAAERANIRSAATRRAAHCARYRATDRPYLGIAIAAIMAMIAMTNKSSKREKAAAARGRKRRRRGREMIDTARVIAPHARRARNATGRPLHRTTSPHPLSLAGV